MYAIGGFGYGLIDAAWSAWLGNMKNANAMSGFLHSCYSLGATLSPTIATTMIVRDGLGWWYFYYFMVNIALNLVVCLTMSQIGCASLSLVFLSTAFWDRSGSVYRLENPKDESNDEGPIKEALKNRITWICALYFFAYVGAEGISPDIHLPKTI